MFAKRSYFLKATPKLLQDDFQQKIPSDRTPRTLPSLENVQSFGWKPAQSEKSTSVTAHNVSREIKEQSLNSGSTVKQSYTEKSTIDETSAAIQRCNVSTSASQLSSKPPRSQPVPVPNSKSHSTRVVPVKGTSKSSNRSVGSNGFSSSKSRHESNLAPPAVAALLAMTSIPKPSSFPKGQRSIKDGSLPKNISVQELMDEWRLEELSPPHDSLHESYSPSLEVLLSPPTDDEEDGGMTIASRSIKARLSGQQLRARSASSDSIPSLSTDDDASLSLSVISSPSSSIFNRHQPSGERRERYSLSRSEDAESDHPLIPTLEPGLEQFPLAYKKKKPLKVQRQSSQTRTSSLKSNLTASLAALRSVARSVSNFAGPSVPPDDYLSSNFFTVPYQSERRPKPIEGVPTPELRRYLNPSGHTAREIHGGRAGGPMYDFHVHGSPLDHTDLEAVAATAAAAASIYPTLPATDANSLSQSTYPFYTTQKGGQPITAIRLQTYSLKKIRKNQRRNDGGDEAIVPVEASPLHYQRAREPRENSDFLRVCVLEMQMRKAGKLESGVPGRARIWLPARAPLAIGSTSYHDALERSRLSKKRWEGISVES